MTFPAVRDVSAEWASFMGQNRDGNYAERYTSAAQFARAPADEAWVFSCVRRLYQSAQGVPLKVYVRAGKDLIPSEDEPSSEGDDLQALLDYANPVDMTGADLKAYTVASYAVWGECFQRKVRGRLGGPPQELYWLRAPDLSISTDDGRTPTAYTIAASQYRAQEVYKPQDVIPFKTPNLVNPMRGLSPLSSISNEISTLRSWSDKLASSIENDSIPPMYWQIPKDAEFARQDEGLIKRALRSLRGPRNRGRVPILPAGLEAKTLALTPQDAEMIAQRKVSRMAVCAALGVPLVLAGDDDKNTVYGNLREAERIFWRGTMIPLLDGYADVYNNWLVPDFDPTRRRLVVGFDYSSIEALKPTWDVEWNAWLAGIYSQAVVPNEFRRHFRLGTDVPWGDKPVPRTAVAIRPDPASLPVGSLPTLDPANEAVLPEVEGIVGEIGDQGDIPDSLRSFGRSLYRQPAIRAFVNFGGPLDGTALLGHELDADTRTQIEDGLRRRLSAEQIAASLLSGVTV